MTENRKIAAYNALEKAAKRIGFNNYKSQIAAHLKKGRSRKTFRFCVTDAHKEVIDAMDKVLSGEITPDEAMAILIYDYDVNKQRFQ